MKQIIKNLLIMTALASFVAAPIAVVASPVAPVASAAADCSPRLLGIPAWYRGLAEPNDKDGCDIVSPDSLGENGLSVFIWRIVLNVIEMALVIVAYIAVFFIIYGGFLFMTGGGNPEQVKKGSKSILNAVIGLVISLGSVAIINLVFTIFK